MTIQEYRISERSLLTPGTAFRARGGPYFVMSDGSECPLSARGPFVFQYAEKHGDLVLLHALDKSGNHAVLHVEGERQPPFEGLVPRPYQIRNRMRKGVSKLKAKRRRK